MARAGVTLSEALLSAYSLSISWLLYAAGSIWRLIARRPRRHVPVDSRRIRSIALIRLDEMGDFVLFSSILFPLRQAFPDAHITLVLCDWVCPLARLCPYVDDVIPFPSGGPKWRQFLLGPLRALRMARRMGRHFDLVINPRFDRDIRGAAFLAHFSLAPWVLGYPSSTEPFKAAVNRGYDRLYTHLLPAPRDAVHELERSRTILEYLGIPRDQMKPELWISAEDRQRADTLLRRHGWCPGDTLICLGITAGYARKRWPMASYLQLAERLKSQTDARFLTVGSNPDFETAELLRPVLGSRLINLAGTAALRVSAAALDRCCLYAGNDSGPKHMAAALGKPVVEINCHPQDGDGAHFQATERFRALTDPDIVLSPCTALAPCRESCMADAPHCITQVSVEQVLDSLVTLLVPATAHE